MLADIVGWLAQNKTWVFSGIGVLALTAIWAVARWLLRKRSTTQHQAQRTGAGSSNLQAGRDIIIQPLSQAVVLEGSPPKPPGMDLQNSAHEQFLSETSVKRPIGLEHELRNDPRIQRLLRNAAWKPAAQAAIDRFIHGKDCQIQSWNRSSTWAQVEMVYKELTTRRP
jgi:hypothetical protein